MAGNTVALKIDGLRELSRAMGKADKDLPKNLRLALNEVSDVIVDMAAKKVPERRGRAKASLKAKSTRTLARVAGGSKGVPYYGWLDFGGRTGRKRSVSRPFLKEGRYIYASYFAIRRSGELQTILETKLRKVIEDAGLEMD